jgi:pimeloyl-ACP methyl ester carboxylesterase
VSRPVPIMFIHGFNGLVDNWEVSGFRKSLIERGADPDLVRIFHYGWADEANPPTPSQHSFLGSLAAELQRLYNNQGDIRLIASRLSRRDSTDPDALRSQLTRLSADSVARGGPEQVTIVAHSMGGLVARYYLSRQTPDEWGTFNEGVVGRLITVATPHLGLDLARIVALVPPDAFILRVLRWLERLPFVHGEPSKELAQLDAFVRAMQLHELAEELPAASQGYFDSPAVRQMIPGSPLLQELNTPGTLPPEVETVLIWGDIRFTGSVRWGPLVLWERTVSLGDLLVTASSASTLPNVTPTRFPLLWEQQVNIQIGSPSPVPEPADVNDYLPPVSHSNLLRHPDVQAEVARLVGL